MSKGLVLALRGTQESQLLDFLGRSSELSVTRRLSEMTEVVAAVSAGVGSVAVVDVASAIDRASISIIRRNAGICIVLCPPSQEEHWEKLGALAINEMLSPQEIAERIESLSRDGAKKVEAPVSAESDPQQVHGQTIVITGPVRTGRSTVALNLAHELARRGETVALVDADIWQPSLALMLGLSPERHGISTLMRRHQEKSMDIAQVRQIGQELNPYLMAITGITAPTQWREATEESLRALCELLTRHFHHVVVDAPTYLLGETHSEWDPGPFRNAAFQTLLSNASHLVIVGNPDVLGMSRLVSFLQVVSDFSALQPRIVMNRMRTSAAGMRARQSVSEVLHEFGGVNEAHFLPEDPKTADRALLRAVPLRDVSEDVPLVEAIESLTGELSAASEPLAITPTAWWRKLAKR